MEAWNIYIPVVIAHYPARALELLAYQRTICDASSRFPAHCWLRYDASFRACAAADRSLRWDAKNNDLWLECFTQHASSQHESEHRPKSEKSVRRPCTYCGNLYHLPDNCSHNPFRSFRGADKWPTTSPRRPYTLHAPGGSYPATSVSATTRTSLNTKPFCKDFNVGECSVPMPAVGAATPPTGRGSVGVSPTLPLAISQHQLVSPLRPLQLERELAAHPDKGFVS